MPASRCPPRALTLPRAHPATAALSASHRLHPYSRHRHTLQAHPTNSASTCVANTRLELTLSTSASQTLPQHHLEWLLLHGKDWMERLARKERVARSHSSTTSPNNAKRWCYISTHIPLTKHIIEVVLFLLSNTELSHSVIKK
jgi:hypothetical protein